MTHHARKQLKAGDGRGPFPRDLGRRSFTCSLDRHDLRIVRDHDGDECTDSKQGLR